MNATVLLEQATDLANSARAWFQTFTSEQQWWITVIFALFQVVATMVMLCRNKTVHISETLSPDDAVRQFNERFNADTE